MHSIVKNSGGNSRDVVKSKFTTEVIGKLEYTRQGCVSI